MYLSVYPKIYNTWQKLQKENDKSIIRARDFTIPIIETNIICITDIAYRTFFKNIINKLVLRVIHRTLHSITKDNVFISRTHENSLCTSSQGNFQ